MRKHTYKLYNYYVIRKKILIMEEIFFRTKLLLGEKNFKKIKNSKILVVGVGGVGSFVVESLVRSGIHNIDICDGDTINITNLNRQIMSNLHNIGESKVDVLKKRALNINQNLNINTYNFYFNENTYQKIDFKSYDYIIDCIDDIKNKIFLIIKSYEFNINIISSMGTGNKINPTELEVCDIYKTSMCPLARIVRRELRKNNINALKVVYSKEKTKYVPKDKVNSSMIFVPATAGLIISSEVIKNIISWE